MKKLFVAISLFGLISNISQANDFASDLHIAIKTTPASVYSMAIGGLSISVPNGFGNNPALNALINDFHLSGAIYQSLTVSNFKEASDLSIDTTTVVAKIGSGALKIIYYNTRSEQALTRLGYDMDFDAESLDISYGLYVTDKLAFGLAWTPIYGSTVESKLGSLTLGEGESKIRGGIRLGSFYRATDKLNLALVYDYSEHNVEYSQIRFTGPASFIYDQWTEKPAINLLRSGVTFTPWNGGLIGAEWLYGKIDNTDGRADVNVSQLFFGIEQWLSENFALRIGCHDGGLTAGFGLAFNNRLFIDYAYADNSYRSMDDYWGSSSSHSISVCLVW